VASRATRIVAGWSEPAGSAGSTNTSPIKRMTRGKLRATSIFPTAFPLEISTAMS